MNELEKRAKQHRKKQKGLSPFCSLKTDAGNVEHNVAMFNHMNSSTEIQSNNPVSGPFGGNIGNGEGMGESFIDNHIKQESLDPLTKLNSLEVHKGVSKVPYELAVQYKSVLNEFPVGTVLKLETDAGEEVYTKTDSDFWNHHRAPWGDIKVIHVFDLARWFAGRAFISRGSIEYGQKELNETYSKNDEVQFEYENLPVTYQYDYTTSWENGPEWKERNMKINYTYSVDKGTVEESLRKLIVDNMPDEEYESVGGDDEIDSYLDKLMSEKFDELVDKYMDQLKEIFEEDAIEDAEENYDFESALEPDWNTMPGGYDDLMESEVFKEDLDSSQSSKLENIEFVMTNYISDAYGVESVKKISPTKYEVCYNGECVSLEFDPEWSGYVYTIDGLGPYQHRSYEYIVSDISDYVDYGNKDSEWTEMNSKRVMDSDGFFTDYTWYSNADQTKHVFVFGDKDIYRPEDGDYDWECETPQEAFEWFENYNGFEDDLDESLEIGNKMTITIGSSINSDGCTIVVTDESDKVLFKEEYSYGYNASYNRKFAKYAQDDYDNAIKYNWKNKPSLKPFIGDIVNELCTKFNINKNDIRYAKGTNLFKGTDASDEQVSRFVALINEDIDQDTLTKACETINVEEYSREDLIYKLVPALSCCESVALNYIDENNENKVLEFKKTEGGFNQLNSENESVSRSCTYVLKELLNVLDCNKCTTISICCANKETLEEAVTDKTLKRIGSYGEFDNGYVFHDWKKMTFAEAEEEARKASIKDPDNIYYVAYDDVMNPSSDYVWIDGKQFDSLKVTLRGDKPYIKNDDMNESTKNNLADDLYGPHYKESLYGVDGYNLYRYIEKDDTGKPVKGYWAAEDNEGNRFRITYAQATGQEPISKSSTRKLSKELGKKLLPNRMNEASYGGAYDIADDQYFTRENADYLAETVEDVLVDSYEMPVKDVFVEIDKQTAKATVILEDEAEYTASTKIDMRKIKIPRDIDKYTEVLASMIYRQVREDYSL